MLDESWNALHSMKSSRCSDFTPGKSLTAERAANGDCEE